MLLRARQYAFEFPRPTLVMGIVNVTPDSFSDGGEFVDTGRAVAHAVALAAEGADILDVGGESTRPQATPVSEGEELRRVLPVLEQLVGRVAVPISIDTMKPGVARVALAAGASIVNDVAANRQEESMWRLVADSGAGYVSVHMQGTPQTMQINPFYADVVAEVEQFFIDRLERLRRCGVRPEQVVLDPGIGFGKALEHNLELIGALRRFGKLGRPMMLGVSRKSFIGKLLGAEVSQRLPGALACACFGAAAGVGIIRAHEVAETVQALRMMEAIVARESD